MLATKLEISRFLEFHQNSLRLTLKQNPVKMQLGRALRQTIKQKAVRPSLIKRSN